MKKIAYLLGIMIGIIFIFGTLYFYLNWGLSVWSGHKEWVASYYTDINDTKTLAKSESFDTLAECKEWGNKQKSEDNEYQAAGFNCGRDCEYTDEVIVGGVRVKTYECKEVISSNDDEKAGPEEYRSSKGVLIEMYSPLKGETVKSPIDILGRVPGDWSFEASFPIELYDSKDNLITSSPASLQGDWMTKDQVLFSLILNFDIDKSEDNCKLVLRKDNPSGLSKYDDQLEIPINLSK